MSERFRDKLRHGWLIGALILVLTSTYPGASSAQPLSEAPNTPLASNLNPLSTLDLTKLDAFKARPLFAITRRQPPAALPQIFAPPPPPPASIVSQAPDLRLVGVVSGVDRAVAILRPPTGGASLTLKVGDKVETWRVHAISPDRVILREGDREQIYRLFAGNGSSNAALPNRAISSEMPSELPGPR